MRSNIQEALECTCDLAAFLQYFYGVYTKGNWKKQNKWYILPHAILFSAQFFKKCTN